MAISVLVPASADPLVVVGALYLLLACRSCFGRRPFTQLCGDPRLPWLVVDRFPTKHSCFIVHLIAVNFYRKQKCGCFSADPGADDATVDR